MARRRRDDQRFRALVVEWLALLASENTRDAYGRDLARFGRWCRDEGIDPLAITAAELRRYRREGERAGATSATLARRLSAIASFASFAVREGSSDTVVAVARPTVRTGSASPLLDDEDAAALLEAADLIAPRTSLLIRLLMMDGLKVGEACRADAEDVGGRPPTMTLRIDDRTIPLHADTAKAVRAYLSRRREGPLLLSEGRVRKSDRLTRFGIDYLVKEAASEAGLSRAVSGSVLRRRYIVTSYVGGGHLADIGRHAGLADVRTARRYLPGGNLGPGSVTR